MIVGQIDPPDLDYKSDFIKAIQANKTDEIIRLGSIWYSNTPRIQELKTVISIASEFIKQDIQPGYTYRILERTIKRFRDAPDYYNADHCSGYDLLDYNQETLLTLHSLKLDAAARLQDRSKYDKSLRQLESLNPQ